MEDEKRKHFDFVVEGGKLTVGVGVRRDEATNKFHGLLEFQSGNNRKQISSNGFDTKTEAIKEAHLLAQNMIEQIKKTAPESKVGTIVTGDTKDIQGFEEILKDIKERLSDMPKADDEFDYGGRGLVLMPNLRAKGSEFLEEISKAVFQCRDGSEQDQKSIVAASINQVAKLSAVVTSLHERLVGTNLCESFTKLYLDHLEETRERISKDEREHRQHCGETCTHENPTSGDVH